MRALNAFRFVLWSKTNSVHTGVSSLNLKEKSFVTDTKYDELIFMKNWDHRNKCP